jgi:methenyltetrahydromethanopterin cyclohydrolase
VRAEDIKTKTTRDAVALSASAQHQIRACQRYNAITAVACLCCLLCGFAFGLASGYSMGSSPAREAYTKPESTSEPQGLWERATPIDEERKIR